MQQLMYAPTLYSMVQFYCCANQITLNLATNICKAVSANCMYEEYVIVFVESVCAYLDCNICRFMACGCYVYSCSAWRLELWHSSSHVYNVHVHF